MPLVSWENQKEKQLQPSLQADVLIEEKTVVRGLREQCMELCESLDSPGWLAGLSYAS